MNTLFCLLACYQNPLIKLETVGEDFLGLGKREINEQAARNRLPFPTMRLTESAKAPRFVRLEDLAIWIDTQGALAKKSWQQSQL